MLHRLDIMRPAGLLERAVQNADIAFVQHVGRSDFRNGVADQPAVGEQRHIGAGAVLHRVDDIEHIFAVNRDLALEGQAAGAGIGQRHRLFGCQRIIAADRPDRVRAGQGGIRSAGIAELDEIAVLGVVGAEQRDDRAVLVDRLAIVLQLEVVDAAAGQVDRAFDLRRLDPDAAGLRQRLVAGDHAIAGDIGSRNGLAGDGVDRGGRCRRGLLLLGEFGLAGLLRHALRLDLRSHVEELPDENDQDRENDRQIVITILLHHSFPVPGSCPFAGWQCA